MELVYTDTSAITFTLSTQIQEAPRTNTLKISETFTPTALGLSLNHAVLEYDNEIQFTVIDSCHDIYVDRDDDDFENLEVEVLESVTSSKVPKLVAKVGSDTVD